MTDLMRDTAVEPEKDVDLAEVDVPVVSVIVSTYNRVHYLERALRSVLAQTFADFEVLVCDDASSEDVAGLLAAIGDDRIRYLRSDANLGMAATNVRGYRAARGRYVAHLDDDDEWTPRFLEVLVGKLEQHPECSLAFCDHAVIDGDSKVDVELSRRGAQEWGRSRLVDGVYRPFVDIAVVHRSVPTSHASVIRRLALDLDLFTAEVGYSWDLWLTYLTCRDSAGAYYTHERLARYRIHGTQSSGGVTDLRTYEALTYCDRRFLADGKLMAMVDRRIFERRFAVTAAYWSVAFLRIGRRDEAMKVARSGLQVRVGPAGLVALALVELPGTLGTRVARAVTGAAVAARRVRTSTWRWTGYGWPLLRCTC